MLRWTASNVAVRQDERLLVAADTPKPTFRRRPNRDLRCYQARRYVTRRIWVELRTFESLSPTDDLVPIGTAGKLIKAVVDNHATHKQVPAFDGGDHCRLEFCVTASIPTTDRRGRGIPAGDNSSTGCRLSPLVGDGCSVDL